MTIQEARQTVAQRRAQASRAVEKLRTQEALRSQDIRGKVVRGQKERQLEALKGELRTQEEQIRQVEVAQRQASLERDAYITVENELRKAQELGGYYSATSIGKIKERFAKAGLDPDEGIKMYKEGVKKLPVSQLAIKRLSAKQKIGDVGGKITLLDAQKLTPSERYAIGIPSKTYEKALKQAESSKSSNQITTPEVKAPPIVKLGKQEKVKTSSDYQNISSFAEANLISRGSKGTVSAFGTIPKTIGYVGTYLGEKTGYTKLLEKKGLNLQVRKDVAEKVGGELLAFSFFSPAMATGAVSKQLSKSKFEKLGEQLNKIRDDLSAKEAGESQLKYLDKLYKKAFRGKKDGKENFKKLVQGLYEEGSFKGVPLEYLSKTPSPKTRLDVVVEVDGLPTMKGAGVLGGATNIFLSDKPQIDPSKVRETQFVKDVALTKTSPKVGSGLATSVFSALSSSTAQTQEQILSQRTTQVPKQTPIQRIANIQAQSLRLKQQSMQTGRFGTPSRTPRKTRKPTKPILPPPSKSLAKRLAEKVAKEPETFSVFARRFGQDIKILETTSKKQAEKKLAEFLTGTLGRSGYLTKKGEKIESSLFQSPIFRPAKKDPLRVVQKAKFSLSAPSEVQEIQFFKRTKKSKKRKGIFDW